MNIQPNTNNNLTMGKVPKKPNLRSFPNRIKQKILDAAPSVTFDDAENKIKTLGKIDGWMSKPAENRAIMGLTAIFLQPGIDASNKRVDDETRHISICRTAAKIIAGTSVGIAVRGASYGLVEKMTDLKSNKKYAKKLLPKNYIEDFSKEPKLLKNYRSALSTGVAIAAMCITNFLIDAPLTVYLTNKFKEMTMLKNAKGEHYEKRA